MMKALLLSLLVGNFLLYGADIENGKALFKKCTSCHGKDGYGKKSQKAPLLAGQYDWYVEGQIKDIRDKKRVNKNTKKMLPFVKNLTDSDIADLSLYISKLQKKQ